MSEQHLTYDEFKIELVRKPHRRHMTLQVRPDGRIRLLMGVSTPLDKIHYFLKQAEDWLEKHLDRLRVEAKTFAPPQFIDGEDIVFLGQPHRLQFQTGVADIWLFDIQGANLIAFIPKDLVARFDRLEPHPELAEDISTFFRAVSMRLLKQRVDFWGEKTGFKPKKLSFRAQNARWGSCSALGSVVLNWKLIVFSMDLIDYVIVHELAHLRHQDHSPRFWSVVETWIPRHKTVRRELRKTQRRADWLIQT